MNNNQILLNKYILFFSLAIILLGVFHRNLWTPDEPRVTAISYEMVTSGNYLIPKVSEQPFLEKPPLYFAVGALFIKIFNNIFTPGQAVRFSSWLWMVGVLLMTFFMVKEFLNKEKAWLSIVILSLFPGFLTNAIWIRVDAALSFFVIASIFSYTKAFKNDKLYRYFLAGVFNSGAFLSKGPIGPILILLGIIPIFFVFKLKPFFKDKTQLLYIHYLIFSFLIFILVSSIWVFLIYHFGGIALFNQWFFDNQLGRFTGKAKVLGHIHKNKPFYYITALLMFTLPFINHIFKNSYNLIKKMFKKEVFSDSQFVGFFWGILTIVFLSIPATKRSVYLLPALPAFALLIVSNIDNYNKSNSKKLWDNFWFFFCIVSSIIILRMPQLSGKLGLDKNVDIALHNTNFWYWFSVLALIIGLALLFNKKKQLSNIHQIFVVTLTFYLVIFLFPLQVINQVKELKTSVQSFTNNLTKEEVNEMAGMDLTETMRGCLVLYSNIKVKNFSNKTKIEKIINGEDEHFKFLIFTSKSDKRLLENLDYKIVKQGIKTDRQLFLIKGNNNKDKKFNQNINLIKGEVKNES